jgi:hypothetical protein
MYRDGKKVANSYHQLEQHSRFGGLLSLSFTNLPQRMVLRQAGITLHPAAKELFDFRSVHFYLWADCCHKYLKFHEEGVKIAGVRHEDLVASPVESSRAIMVYCGFPEDWAQSVVKAMETDSMQTLKAKKKHVTSIHVDPKVATTYCEIFGLPHHSTVLPGTITKHE